MESGHVHPVLLRGERSRQLDIALPERDRLLGIHLLVDERQVVEGAGILRVSLDHFLVLADGLLIEPLVLVHLGQPHPRLEVAGIEVDGLLVGLDGLVIEPLLRVVELAQAHVDLGVDRVEAERLLVGGDGAVHITLGGLGVAQADIGVGVERSDLERLGVGFHGLVEQTARRREEQVAESLVWLRIGRVELGGGAELGRSLPAIPQALMDHAQGMLRHHELRIDLGRLAEQLDGRLVALLVAPIPGEAPSHVGLEGARRGRRARPLLHSRRLAVAERHLERARIGERNAAEPLHQRVLGKRHHVEGDALESVGPELQVARLDGQLRAGPAHLTVDRDLGVQGLRGGRRRRLVPRFGLGDLLEPLAIDLDQRRRLNQPEHQRLRHRLTQPLLVPGEVRRGERQEEDAAGLGGGVRERGGEQAREQAGEDGHPGSPSEKIH